MPLRQLSTITKMGMFMIEIRTPNVLSHSIMTDNPEAWERISQFIQHEMNQIIIKPK